MRTLLAFLTLCAVAAAQARVEGRVVATTGEPIGKATVRLNGGGQPSASYVEVSGPDGRFLFENVPPGRYAATAQKLSYAPPASGPQPAFVLAAGEAKRDLEIKLTPLAVVTGAVTDFDGDPVAGAQVQLMRRGYTQGHIRLQPAMSASSDDRGRFRVVSVAPGRYYLMANDPASRTVGSNANEIRGPSARDVNLSTYYPNSAEVSGAIPVEVKAGGEISNVNVRMRRGRTYTARGVAVDESGAPAQVAVTLYQASDEGPSANMSTNSRTATGAFEFRGLVPGSYTLLVRSTPRNTDAGATLTVVNAQGVAVARPTTQAPPAVSNLSGRLDFIIASGDLENLTIRLTQGAEITGRVRLDGDGDLAAFLVSAATTAPRVVSPDGRLTVVPQTTSAAPRGNPPTVSLLSDEGNSVRSGTAVAPDGTFRITNLTPSKYMVSVGPLAPGAYIKSIRWGGQDLTNALLDLTSGNGGAMDIVVSPRAATLNGVARNGRGEVMPSGTVTMWPGTRLVTDQQGGVRNLRSSPEGTFQFTGLAPGDYYAVLWEEVPQDLSRIPDFLDLVRSGATRVSVTEGETASMELKPISRDTVEKAVDQFR